MLYLGALAIVQNYRRKHLKTNMVINCDKPQRIIFNKAYIQYEDNVYRYFDIANTV